jgi:hypothetical protein
MSVGEIKAAIAELPADELADLVQWIEERTSAAWDQQIASDLTSGRFEPVRQRVRDQRLAGVCKQEVPGSLETSTQ